MVMRNRIQTIYNKILFILAGIVLKSAYTSLSQCCIGTTYQIPIGRDLKKKIKQLNNM